MVPTTTTFFVCLLVLYVTHARPSDLQLISDRLTRNMRTATSYRMGYLFGKRSEAISPAETGALIQNIRQPSISSLITDLIRRKEALLQNSQLKMQNTKEPNFLLN